MGLKNTNIGDSIVIISGAIVALATLGLLFAAVLADWDQITATLCGFFPEFCSDDDGKNSHWIAVRTGEPIPAKAIDTGDERTSYQEVGKPDDLHKLYVCMADNKIGKVGASGRCDIPYYRINTKRNSEKDLLKNRSTENFSSYKILVDPESELYWEDANYSGTAFAVEASDDLRPAVGDSLSICKAYYSARNEVGEDKDGWHPGFVDKRIDKCIFVWDDDRVGFDTIEKYELLFKREQ
ncbi:hypothetical protein PN498_20800 [Oscillatoria sp. CS-180]|uniref:hypothetical protein n=1 Tax=Oscillatoria sp. CS-180 TaxID=3021720 RepID=UPI00232CB197|nr:hypothetical protein [Oscillatoria sp. CS-180]MDB9528443.1 hypothetical protein [Oscillatoria sp. CS-180]